MSWRIWRPFPSSHMAMWRRFTASTWSVRAIFWRRWPAWSSGPGAVLLASSANIYGNAPVEVIDESVAPAPANDYAVSKLAMEYMARLWMDRLPIVITRPFNYTGVGQAPQFLLPKIVGHFQRGERVIELGNIDVERDFSDVRTVASAYAVAPHAPAGEVFNVCSGVAFRSRMHWR